MTKRTARQTVREYMDYATIHGVGRTKNAPYILFKVLWTLALCGSLAMITLQVITLYEKLNSYPISTSIEIMTEKSLNFPRIMFCNTNPASYYKIPYESELNNIVEEASKKYSISLSMFNATDIYGYNYSTYDDEAKQSNISDDILFYTAEQFKMKLAVKDIYELINISQPLDAFLMLCNFAGKPCSKEAFTIVRSYDYGLCYKFDSAYQKEPITKISAAGPRYSLEMLLYVDESASIPFVTSSTGVVVSAEATDTDFHPENAVFISTGFEANIALSQVQEKRVPGKSSAKRCNDDEWAPTLLECQVDCRQQYIFYRCDCYQHFFNIGTLNDTIPLNITFDEETGYRPCYTENDYKCILATVDELATLTPDICLGCLQPCDEVSIKHDVSMIKWPGDNLIPIIRRILQSRLGGFGTLPLSKEFVRNNLVLVRLYMSSLSYSVMTEEYAYSEVDFISDIGGQLGLWAGFSVLSLLEVVELCFLLCASYRGKKTSPDKPEADDVVHPYKNT